MNSKKFSMAVGDFFKKRQQNQQEFRPRDFLPLRDKSSLVARRLEEKKTKGGTKWVLGLLLGSIFLSLTFWFWGKTTKGNFRQNDQTISTNRSLSTPAPHKTAEVKRRIGEITSGLEGTYGVYVFNLTTKEDYGLLQNEIFTAASLIKLPVMLSLYQQVEKGDLNLEDKYVLKEKDKRSGAGSLQYRKVGTSYSLRQLAELMGRQSDNTAFAALLSLLGEGQVQETIQKLGVRNTSLAKNETTPEDIGLFFRKLYGGSILTREHRDEILGFLTDTIYEDRIPAGVPEGTRVAHKIGNEAGVFSDAGIVFGQKPFVLVVMSKNALESEAKTALVEITKTVWEFENK